MLIILRWEITNVANDHQVYGCTTFRIYGNLLWYRSVRKLGHAMKHLFSWCLCLLSVFYRHVHRHRIENDIACDRRLVVSYGK
jgi:hypothetical protein